MHTLKSICSAHQLNTDKDNKSHSFSGKSYLDVYDTILPNVLGVSGNVMEIGVLYGGSLILLKHYFGVSATVVGIDIDPARKRNIGDGIVVETGSQSDESFLGSMKDKYGPFRLILDDGSHVVSHMLKSFECLWPSVAPGGVYIMEDLAISYYGPDNGWPGMEYNKPEELQCSERGLFDKFVLELVRKMDHRKGDVRKIEFHSMIIAIHKV